MRIDLNKIRFSVIVKEEGRGKGDRTFFTTLAKAAEYVRDRWEGADYIDGPASFHNDYCTFTLVGFTLRDIGTIRIVDGCREFRFKEMVEPEETFPGGYEEGTTHA